MILIQTAFVSIIKAAIYIDEHGIEFAIFNINNLDGTSGWILKTIYKNSLKFIHSLKKEKGHLKTFKTTLMLYYLKLKVCTLDLFSATQTALDVMSMS